MAYTPYPISRFSGLRLDVEPEQIGAQDGCVDCLNVDVSRPGAVRVRDGFDNFTSSASSNRYQFLHPHSDTSLLAGASTTVEAINTSGTVVATQTALDPGADFATIGLSGGASITMIAGPASGDYIWNGTAFSASGGLPATSFILGVTPTDNRLVAVSTDSGATRVNFSDPGVPTTFGANNYVELEPGGRGGGISAVASWGGSVFVFKRNKFFVFYGQSTDSAGNPIFNYRPVDAGVGVVSLKCACAGPDGVYFAAADGIYRTTGGPPQKISQALDPLWRGGSSSLFSYSTPFALVGGQLTFANGKLYVPFSSADTSTFVADGVLVWDRDSDTWTVWNIPATALCAWRTSATALADSVFFSYASGSKHIGRIGSSYTTDDGTAIVSRYRSGLYTVGNQPTQEVVVRESMLEGIGTPTYSVSHDYAAVPTTGGGAKAAVTLGTSPAYDNGWHTVDQEGRRFSYQIEATSGRWQVNSITHHVLGIQTPGAEAA